MKSIKPGRGPSKLNMVSAIGAAVFGVFWCVFAVAIGGGFMLPFGIIFIVIAIAMCIRIIMQQQRTDIRFLILLMKMRKRIH